MQYQRSDFPVHAEEYTLGLGEQPVLLDGMEVVFDRTVGLAPAALVADQPAAAAEEADASRSSRRT